MPPSLRNASWSCRWSSSRISDSPPKKGDCGPPPPPLAGLISCSSPTPAISSAALPLLTLLLLENTGCVAQDEGEETDSGEGAVPPPPQPPRPEFWRDSMKGEEWAAEVGEAGSRPRSLRALAMTASSSASGPKARRIISFSPWSWMSSSPMILAAWSGSSPWIRANTTFVASYASMPPIDQARSLNSTKPSRQPHTPSSSSRPPPVLAQHNN